MWELPLLKQYSSITVGKDANNTLKVTFPTVSPDNILFFTNYILPQHMLMNSYLNDYTSIFAFKPVYTNCSNLVSQSNDEYSLVFNLVNCNQSNLNFYQVKNITQVQPGNVITSVRFVPVFETRVRESLIQWLIGSLRAALCCELS